MARIRTVKPEFWEDETIGLLSPLARLLFIATWNLADDEGLLRWSPVYIKATAFMYDDLALDHAKATMDELVEHGLVFPYIGGKARQQLAFIVQFRRHQRINRPQPGKLPPPSVQSTAVAAMYARRDGWVCHLCKGEIPQERFGVDEGFYLSLDHLVPRSEGGSDYPSNIAAAHIRCNKSRGARPMPGAMTGSVNDSVNDAVTDSPPEGKGREQGEGEGSTTVVEQARPDDPIQTVFDAWRQATGKHRARLDDKRLRRIKTALRSYSLADVLDAVRGWQHSPHHRGENEHGAVYNELDLLLRDAAHIEQFRDLWRNGPSRVVSKQTAKAMRTSAALRARAAARAQEGVSHDLRRVEPAGGPPQRGLPAPAD